MTCMGMAMVPVWRQRHASSTARSLARFAAFPTSENAGAGCAGRDPLIAARRGADVSLPWVASDPISDSRTRADGPGATTPTDGPTLCHDKTAPPCNDR